MGFKATVTGSVLGAGLLLYVGGNAPAMPDVSGLIDPFLPNPAMVEIEVSLAGEDLKRSELDTKERAIEVAEKELESKLRMMDLEKKLTQAQIDLATQQALSQEMVKQQVEKELLEDWAWSMVDLAWRVIGAVIAPILVVIFFVIKALGSLARYKGAIS